MKHLIRIFTCLFCLISVMAIAKDSPLVELAKKEKERRAKIEAKKTFTNQDIDKVKGKQLGIESSSAPETEKEGEGKEEEKKADPSQTEEYWRGKRVAAQSRVKEAQEKVDQLQNDINALTRAIAAQSDAAQGPIIQSEKGARMDELEGAKKELADAQAELSGLEDEARKAGVPPGWVRE